MQSGSYNGPEGYLPRLLRQYAALRRPSDRRHPPVHRLGLPQHGGVCAAHVPAGQDALPPTPAADPAPAGANTLSASACELNHPLSASACEFTHPLSVSACDLTQPLSASESELIYPLSASACELTNPLSSKKHTQDIKFLLLFFTYV